MYQKIKLSLIIWGFGLKPIIKKLDKENYKEIMKTFKKHYIEINARTEKTSGIVRFHMMASVIGLAFYKVLPDYIQDRNEVIDIIHDIIWKPRMSKNVGFIAFFVRRSKDPFNNFLKFLGPRNEWFFPVYLGKRNSLQLKTGSVGNNTNVRILIFSKKKMLWRS
jgi:hypothetical protein